MTYPPPLYSTEYYNCESSRLITVHAPAGVSNLVLDVSQGVHPAFKAHSSPSICVSSAQFIRLLARDLRWIASQ